MLFSALEPHDLAPKNGVVIETRHLDRITQRRMSSLRAASAIDLGRTWVPANERWNILKELAFGI